MQKRVKFALLTQKKEISILLSAPFHRIDKVNCAFLVPINLQSSGKHVPCRFKYLVFPPFFISYPFCFLLYENFKILYSTLILKLLVVGREGHLFRLIKTVYNSNDIFLLIFSKA